MTCRHCGKPEAAHRMAGMEQDAEYSYDDRDGHHYESVADEQPMKAEQPQEQEQWRLRRLGGRVLFRRDIEIRFASHIDASEAVHYLLEASNYMAKRQQTRIQELEAEAHRYREALERIAKLVTVDNSYNAADVHDLARQALEQRTETTPERFTDDVFKALQG